MVCWRTETGDEGLATAAAAVFSLCLALVIGSLVLVSAQELKQARLKLAKAQAEYVLAGAHVSAVSVMLNAQPARLTWEIDSPVGKVTLLAEPEDEKLGPGEVALQSSQDPTRIGNFNLGNLPGKLKSLTANPPPTDELVRALDNSPTWRRCWRTIASPWGRSTGAKILRAQTPRVQHDLARVPRTWRIIAVANGWRDERTEIVTGVANHPVVLREQDFGREIGDPLACDDLLKLPVETSQGTTATP